MDEKEVVLQGEETPKKKRKILPVITIILALAVIAGSILGVMLYSRYKGVQDELKAKNIYGDEFFYYDSLSLDTFKRMVADGEELVVIIGRPNCGDCSRMAEPVKALVERLGIREKVYYLNIAVLHKNTEAWNQFKEDYGGLGGTPTYARYADGKLASSVGWTAEQDISIELVEAWILEQQEYFGF